MSTTLPSLAVIGTPQTAWFVGCVLARFVAAPGQAVHVAALAERTAPSDTKLVFNSDMLNLHSAIGFDLQRVQGCMPCTHWRAEDVEIALAPPPIGIAGIPNEQIYAREAPDKLGYYLLGLGGDSSAYTVPVQAYANAIEDHARAVGLGGLSTSDVGPDEQRIFTSEQPSAPRDEDLCVGQAAIGVAMAGGLNQRILAQTLKALLQFWPSQPRPDLDRAVYNRRIAALKSHILAFEALVYSAEPPHAEARNRINVWRKLARLIPVDHDPFQPHEWMTVLVKRGHLPTGYLRAAEARPAEDTNQHLLKMSDQGRRING